MSTEPQLLQNAAYIKEADLYIASVHRHDFVTYRFKNGKELSLDGGLEYTRRVGDLWSLMEDDLYVEFCLNDACSFEEIADKLLWGTRGKDGTGLLERRPIKELAARLDGVEHMRAILTNCPAIGPFHKRVVEHWLQVELDRPRVAI